LIGVNTAIVGPSGGNVGIGFAVPANIAKSIMTDLIRNGAVKRGEIGIYPQDLTPNIASGLGIERRDGVLVVDVAPDSAAARAELAPGDLIIAIDGAPIHTVADFRRRIDFAHVGDKLRLSIISDGTTKTVAVTVEAIKPESNVNSGRQIRQGERRL
jgi:serine protease DegQ